MVLSFVGMVVGVGTHSLASRSRLVPRSLAPSGVCMGPGRSCLECRHQLVLHSLGSFGHSSSTAPLDLVGRAIGRRCPSVRECYSATGGVGGVILPLAVLALWRLVLPLEERPGGPGWEVVKPSGCVSLYCINQLT